MTSTMQTNIGRDTTPSDALQYRDGDVVGVNTQLCQPNDRIRIWMGYKGRYTALVEILDPSIGLLRVVSYNGLRFGYTALFEGAQSLDDFDSKRAVDPGNRWMFLVGMRYVIKTGPRPEVSRDMVTAIAPV